MSALTLDEALAAAMAHNRQIRLAGVRVSQGQQELEAEKTRRLPVSQMMAVGGVSLTRADVTFPQGALGEYPGTGPIPGRDTRVGIPRQISGFSMSSISQPLTQQIRIGAGIESARISVSLAEKDRDRTEQEVRAQVRQLYFGLLGADAAMQAAESNVTLAREVERLATRGVETGVTLPADRGEASARRARAEAVLASVRTERENLREQFNLLLGRPLTEAVRVMQPEIPADAGLTAEAAAERAASGRPEVDTARLRIRQAELAVKSKKAELIPDVSFTLQHFGFLNTGNLAPSNYAVAGLQVNWEPWDWGRRRSEARALRHQADAARLALEETQQQVRRQASQAVRAWEQSAVEIQAAETAVQAAQESVRVARQRFEQQAALLRQVLEAQTTFETAQEQRVRAIAARGTAWANLQLATGNR